MGFWVLVDAVGALVQSVRPGTTGRIWFGLLGGLGLVAAVLAIVTPAMTAVAATWAVGVWLAFRGGVELFGAVGATVDTSRWLLVVSGGISVLVGVLLAANPGRAAIALATWFGVALLVWGVIHLGLAHVVHRHARDRTVTTGRTVDR
ncbi:DUF308 domain-containing protein [Nocardioides aurantiacus]|uniref:Uncharacterized membrane protein HdeD (DUF308 family) n=1 Tax=Nocardioides aurantiacus TaxID=86796 RepID=A0A3N2CTL5_9ACTN|nr:DUF308 domain-containing protein [Nocardioides aurantiacus]ROR90855.1 uncharacterized membrane protein HdeD (DUF308 family) [Nocardioides aurantiacus]